MQPEGYCCFVSWYQFAENHCQSLVQLVRYVSIDFEILTIALFYFIIRDVIAVRLYSLLLSSQLLLVKLFFFHLLDIGEGSVTNKIRHTRLRAWIHSYQKTASSPWVAGIHSCLAGLVGATALNGGSNLRITPGRPEFTDSIRHISFRVYRRNGTHRQAIPHSPQGRSTG